MYTSKIDSFEAACAYIGMSATLPDVSGLPVALQTSTVANYKLTVINGALNHEANGGKEWKPKYDGSEPHWFPYFYRGDDKGAGFRFVGSYDDYLHSSVGSRREYKTEAVSDYAGETFVDLYRDADMIQGDLFAQGPSQ